jgi:hypothetical protein
MPWSARTGVAREISGWRNRQANWAIANISTDGPVQSRNYEAEFKESRLDREEIQLLKTKSVENVMRLTGRTRVAVKLKRLS